MSVQITFLGTSSGAPTKERNVSGTCIQLPSSPYFTLIDCGEGTQHRFQLSTLKMGKLKDILITHSHGDHIFGLPGLLCSMSGSNAPDRDLVTITGPLGLRQYLLSSLTFSDSHLNFDLHIREIVPRHVSEEYLNEYLESLKRIPMTEFLRFLDSQEEMKEDSRGEGGTSIDTDAMENKSDVRNEKFESDNNSVCEDTKNGNHTSEEENFGEDGMIPRKISGEFIHYDKEIKGYEITKECPISGFKILASPIQHRVFCVGYIFVEKEQPGPLDVKLLKVKFGLSPGPFCSKLKAGEEVTVESPQSKQLISIKPSDIIGPSIPGRKLVFLGDTHDPTEIRSLAQNCDILVHESTLENSQKALAIERGHSVPSMAAEFAKSISCKKLILSHFSARFPRRLNENDDPNTITLDTLREQAISIFGENVEIAEDLKTFEVKKKK